MTNTSWRFINTGHLDAATNMAIDEVISQFSVPRDNKPVLRVYGWEPYAISLGYNQDENDVDLEKCQEDGIDVVRRPTGGRAVFHAEEVTYSFSIPKSFPYFDFDTLSVYNIISEGLVEGLKSIGIPAVLQEKPSENFGEYHHQFPCFSSSARYEVACQGKKLIGSAQRRFENSILQHGSILLGIEHLKIGDYISDSKSIDLNSFTKELYRRTISIAQINPAVKKFDKVVWGIKNGFQRRFQIQFLEGQLTPQEWQEVQKLTGKYKQFRRV
ncbi:lipoate--protein ligase family protein [candidate division KSB1 bacterium]|nr:lipoate--protein ligase family protein [candidate division KSB1 bacterium]